jgi:hypothetical protein
VVWNRSSNSATDVPGCASNCFPVAWSHDGASLFLASKVTHDHFEITQVNIRTKQRKPWKTVGSNDAPGVEGAVTLVVAPDADAYAYSMHLLLSSLDVVDGWRGFS